MSRQGTELRQKRRQLGLCCQCGSPDAKGKSRCPRCLEKAAASRRKYVARMTPDEREKMYAKEIQRQKMARMMAVKIRHMKYIEEVKSLEKKDTPKVTVKLTELAQRFLQDERESCIQKKERNKMIAFNDEKHTIAEWSKITGLSYNTIRDRLRCGWSIEDALTRRKKVWRGK